MLIYWIKKRLESLLIIQLEVFTDMVKIDQNPNHLHISAYLYIPEVGQMQAKKKK